MKNGSDNTRKIRRFTREEIKQQLIDSFINSDKMETEELNEKADKVEKSKDVAIIVKEYKEIIRTTIKNTVRTAYHERKVFKKFKEGVSLSN